MAFTERYKLKVIFVLALAIISIKGEAKNFRGLLSSQPGNGTDEGGAIFDVTKYGAKCDGKEDSTMVSVYGNNITCSLYMYCLINFPCMISCNLKGDILIMYFTIMEV